MKAIVIFRDSVILNYEKNDIEAIKMMLENRLVDFFQYTKTILIY
jgi:uncharacterized protein YutE (UPF0331/DUF86 family)